MKNIHKVLTHFCDIVFVIFLLAYGILLANGMHPLAFEDIEFK
jgi:ABC-type thiamin/hydroxymethylpyrimidine transport system permease subunit